MAGTKMSKNDMAGWLPTSIEEASLRDWSEFDVILFSGDAYIDHPSFAAAVIGRVIEDEGLRVGIVPQPNWRDDLRDFRKLGRPGMFFGVTAGNMDSMVNHYTAFKRRRSDDSYTPGGRSGFRPDYPSIVYTRILKELFPDVPVIIGGIEASMRRLAHYDYWNDRVDPSIIISSKADLLVYGMGEQPLRTIITLLKKGVPFSSLTNIPQTVFAIKDEKYLPRGDKSWKTILLPSYEKVLSDKKSFSEAFVLFEKESHKINSARLVQNTGDNIVVANPPFAPATTEEVDRTYDLPYTRLPHPRYNSKPPVPAYEMIKYSVNIHRGCFGGCSFCAIAAHQGKHVVSRSEKSVLSEIEKIGALPGFKGILTDLGGPSANMYSMKATDPGKCLNCSRPSCIWPSVCPNLETDHTRLTKLYRQARSIPGIKRIFIGSGVRYDLLLQSFNKRAGRAENEYLSELLKYHISGRFKVAPEHTSKRVLDAMRKPSFELYGELKARFDAFNRREGLKQELIPYFISSHPGSGRIDMARLAIETKKMGLKLEQVQDFTPTPMTLSTTIYYTGYDPYTGKKMEVAHTAEEKRMQNNYFFWYDKTRATAIRRDLIRLGRPDLAEMLLESVGKGANRSEQRKRRSRKSK